MNFLRRFSLQSARNARTATLSQKRWARTMDFGGTEEVVYERSDYPLDKLKTMFANDKFAMLGYGTQGRNQALNLKDQGFDVCVGLREGPSWDLAIKDGFVPGKTLFSIEEAAKEGTVVMYLMSDSGQKYAWDTVKPCLTPGKTLYFSHGFSVVFNEDTGVVPPEGIDVVLVAPKGSGTTVRRLFQQGRGINSSVAVAKDASGNARDRAFGIGAAVGSGYMYETTFKAEVMSDLTGERGVLMGAIAGLFQAQYNCLRKNGHTPSEAFNESVEEATQSLYPLIGEKGMDWMFANCSTTAQRGALDWMDKFQAAVEPVFDDLYSEVANGNETRRSIEVNAEPDYKEKLEAELKTLREKEIWRAGVAVRSLRPENMADKRN